jgi:uncharacterized membrane protein
VRAFLHGPGFVINGPHHVFASYPLIPWIGVVLAMYPLCRRFAGVKQRRRDPWLSYW